jgi:hypothetical protein
MVFFEGLGIGSFSRNWLQNRRQNELKTGKNMTTANHRRSTATPYKIHTQPKTRSTTQNPIIQPIPLHRQIKLTHSNHQQIPTKTQSTTTTLHFTTTLHHLKYPTQVNHIYPLFIKTIRSSLLKTPHWLIAFAYKGGTFKPFNPSLT